MESHLKTGGEEQYIRSNDKLIKVTQEAENGFKDLKLRRKHRYIVYRIQGEEIEIETTGAVDHSHEKLLSVLPDSECRFIVYDHDILTDDGRRTSKLYFISWLPLNSTPSMKMAYTHGKGILRNSFEGCYDLNASTKSEIVRGIGMEPDAKSDSGSEFEDD